MIIKLLVDGGSMTPGPAIGQQLGPIGINIGDVIAKVNQATSEFKGMQVPVVLDVNTKTKEFSIDVKSPSTTELLKKEYSIEKGSDDKKKQTVANSSIEQIIKISKTKHNDMLSKDLKSTVKSVVGTCVAMGIMVENKPAQEIQEDIENGDFDDQISGEKAETSPEKLAKLKEFLNEVTSKQEAAKLAEEEAAKLAEEEAKAAAAEGAEGAPAEGAEGTPAEGAEGTPAEGVAPAAGKKK